MRKIEKALRWSMKKEVIEQENGKSFIRFMCVDVKLADDCGNGHYDFSITGELTTKGGAFITAGCCHELIAKHFPELRKFIPLHLCNRLGEPMYAIQNSTYFAANEEWGKVKSYLRLTDSELLELKTLCANGLHKRTSWLGVDSYDGDSLYIFAKKLVELGVADRWKTEADEFIKWLEDKTCCEWVSPYEEEKSDKYIKEARL